MLKYQQKTYRLFVIPTIVVTVLFLLFPLTKAVRMSFTNLDFLKNTNASVGLENYQRILSDIDFYKAFGRTIIYVAVVVFFNFIIGFSMALVCNQNFRGNRILRAIIILPMLLIPVSAAILWRFMYNYDMGVINKALSFLGINGPNWLGDTNFALMSILITDIWAWTPWMFLILLAGLEGLPIEPLEAAKIDGATGFPLLRLVILPMMRPITTIAISLKAIETFRTFPYVWVMTRGGPGGSTDIVSTFIYKQAFKHLRYGYSAALSIVVIVFICVISLFMVSKVVIRSEA